MKSRLRFMPLADRLDFCSIPEPMSGCTLWLGAVGGHGYGVIRYQNYIYRAHRLAWIAKNGEAPAHLVVRHKCDNKLCINVDHLCLGTQAENIADKVSRSRQARGETAGKAKLTNADVLKIREDVRTQREIAADFGVSMAVISCVKRRVTWRHV